MGRRDELAAVDHALDALTSSGSVLALVGEPGIGKSWLLAELCARADSRKALVLDGRAAELERDEPFAVFVHALDDYLASLNPRSYETLGEQDVAELARIFPSLNGLADDAPATPGDERYRSHRAVRALLEKLAGGRPLVLALDDMHWADEASLELLSHLLRRRPRAPVLLALAFRARQAPPRLRTAIDQAAQDGEVERVEIGPLDLAEAEELLAALVDPAYIPDLHRESGGNPLYLDRLARAVRERGFRPRGGDGHPVGGDDVPEAVVASISTEVAELPEEARTLLRAASVIGEDFEPDLASEIAEMSQSAALSSLDVLLDHDLIRTTDVPRRFRFRHPILRRAVYDAAKPGWRLAAHGRAAAVLESRGMPALARAPHVERSARPGDEAGIALLTEAGHAAAPRAPGAASHWFDAALRLLRDDDPGRRLGLLVPRAQALAAAGGFEEARETLDQVLALIPPDQPAVRGQVVASAARIDQIIGRHGDAMSLLTGALEELPDEPSREATELKISLAAECFFTGEFDGMRRWVEEALADSTSQDDAAARAAATGLLGGAQYMVDETESARQSLDSAADLFAELPDDELARRLNSLAWCGICEVYLERFDRALALFERGLEVALATGHGHIPTLMRIGQGLALLWRGRLEEGTARIELAIDASLLTGNRQFLTWAMWVRCWAATLAGDLATAVRAGEDAMDAAGDMQDPVSAFAGCYLAAARLEAGEDPERCHALVLEAAGGPELALVERGFKSHLYEILTLAKLEADDLDAARNWAERGEAAADGLGIDGRSAEALRARAAVELAAGDAYAATEAALEAIGLAESSRLPIEAARARILAGRALAAAGDRERAIAELERARQELDALGAVRYRDHAAQELRRLGRRVARKGRTGEAGEGIEALSGRELEIAELVSHGKTNREIAEVLFLSPKTIENHLSRIFSKLEVSSRTEVARQVTSARENVPG